MAVGFFPHSIGYLVVKISGPRCLAAWGTFVLLLGNICWVAQEFGLSLIQQSLTFSNTVIAVASSLPENFHTTIQYLERQSGIPADNINAAISQFQSQATDFARSLASNAVNAIFVITNALLNIVLV